MTDEQDRKREHEDQDLPDEPQAKRTRVELLETYYAKVNNLLKARQSKEIRLKEQSKVNQNRFLNAMKKEVNNNFNIGAYKALTLEESAQVRKQSPEKVMESRYVMTAKPLEPGDVEEA